MIMNKLINDYISNLIVPNYHSIRYVNGTLIMSHQNLYVEGNIVFAGFDKVSGVNLKRFKIKTFDNVKDIIDNFIKNAKERSKTRPYVLQRLYDIDSIGEYNVFGDMNNIDEGHAERHLTGAGRCTDINGKWV